MPKQQRKQVTVNRLRTELNRSRWDRNNVGVMARDKKADVDYVVVGISMDRDALVFLIEPIWTPDTKKKK